MEKKILNFIKQNNLIDDNNTIICAVSGGVDSICLLDILIKLKYNIVLAHVNHNKRDESVIEEKAMRNLALKLNVPFELLDYNYDGIDNFHNDSHKARYNFFRSLCDKYNTSIIATAHHLDDQVETILIKLLEGSNLYGYGGISNCNYDGKYKIVRPLLCLCKDDLYAYANKNNLVFYEDKSNDADDFLRNRIRHHVIPNLKRESECFYTKVAQFSDQLKEAFTFIRRQSIDYLNSTNNMIDVKSFNKLDNVVKKDIIALLLEKYNLYKCCNIIDDILGILASDNGTKSIDLEQNHIFIRNYDFAMIKLKDTNIIDGVFVNVDSEAIFNGKYKLYLSHNLPSKCYAKYIKLCYNSLVLPLIVRSKRDGDIINLPIGSKKISRIFIDNKVSLNERNKCPIITDSSNTILWVYDIVKSKEVINQKDKGNIYLVCEEI